MAIYQRILAPIDGNAASGRALQEVIRLAEGKAQIRLVYILEEFFPLDAEGYAFHDYALLQEAARHVGERVLAQAVEKVQQSGAAVESALLEANGERIASAINDEASRWQADLIVIGTHGRSGLNRLLLGSVAEGVMRGASTPVLLVHGE